MLHRNRKVELLKRVPLFADCSRKELEEVATVADQLDFRAGRTLIREGTAGREFFVLVDGTAEVRRKGRKIDVAGPGDFFGEMALLSDRPRNATVTTTSTADVLVVTKRNFRTLVERNPLIALKVMRAVAERVPADEL
jgi:CRP/FNR family transcriptional regulator, cyclic AMP receptor protein